MNTSIFSRFQSAFQKRLGRLLLILIGLLLGVALLSWLLLPNYIKQIAEQQTEQQLGRKLTIGSVSFSPFALALRADNIHLYEADGRNLAAQIDYVDINLSLSSLIYRALVLDELRLHQPQLHLQRISAGAQARYNFSDILDKLAQSPKSDSPLSFSITNIRIDDASLSFDDQALHEHNEITHLNLGLPFVSNFPREIHAFVEPSLTAYINGAGFALNARSKPFSNEKETRLALDLEQLDIRPLLAYSPVQLPLQVASARLSSKLDLIFKQGKQPEIILAGHVDLAQVDFGDSQGQHLLKFDRLHIGMNKLNLLNGTADLGSVELDAPQVWLALDSQQRFNWLQMLSPTGSQQNTRAVTGSNPVNQPKTPDRRANPLVTVQQFTLRKGQLNWRDQFFAQPEQQVKLADIELQLKQLSTAANAPPATVQLDLQPADAARLHVEGGLQLAPAGFDGKWQLQQLPLVSLQGYLKPYLNASLSGLLSSQAQLTFNDGQWQIHDATLELAGVNLQPGARNNGSLSFDKLSLDGIHIDSASSMLKAGSFQLDGLNADLQRDQQGQLNLLGWLNSSATRSSATRSSATRSSATGSSEPVPNQATKPAKPAWQYSLDTFRLNASQLRFSDQSVSPAVRIAARDMQLRLDHIDQQFSHTLGFSLQSQLNRNGRIQLQGSLAPALKQIQVGLNGKNLPLTSLYPYFSSALNVQLNKGSADLKGQLAVRDPMLATRQINFNGNLSLNDFDIVQNQIDEDFLNWNNISLDNIQFQQGGKQNLLQIGQLSLKQFFARAVLSEQGKLNLQQILAKPDDRSGKQDGDQPARTEPAAAGSSTAPAPTAPAPFNDSRQASALVIRIAQTKVVNGNINFTDHFIKPNYHANLTGISGNIGMLASDQTQPASIELNGKVDDDAPLLISGSLNPLSNPVFLDLKGSANGIELSRLTPYATKYAGYSIEKGKLSMQVSYRIEAGQLKAENSLTLDQLTFGDKVDSPSATRLPVMLAVALLRDNDGKIAINLPISGSLSDPQFSVGGIIVKVFVNLITKAVTSPFALLGSMFGSGEELSFVTFPAGSAELLPATSAKLDHLIHALEQRQSLKLDITGQADFQADSEGLKAAVLDRQLKQAKWTESSRANRPQSVAQVNLSAGERERYIQQLYKQAQFAKPKNMLGLNKSLATSEAEQLLLKNLQISDEDLRMLAQKRADQVRDYLENTGKLSRERLFLIAPKVTHDGDATEVQSGRVDFALK